MLVRVNKSKVDLELYEDVCSLMYIDFNTAFRVRQPEVLRCRIVLGSEKMEEVSEFKYLATVSCKHGGSGRRNKGASDERS